MANQPEQPIFDSGVYQLEQDDPVLGGYGGLSNIPLLNLANRTSWLKQEVDAIIAALPTKAPLDSPALTGIPTAPTQSLENATTRIATTAFARGIVSGKMEKVLSGTSGATLTENEAGNGLLVFSGAITAAVNVVVPSASRRWIAYNGTSGGHAIALKTATAAGVSVPPGMALEVWCDGAILRTIAAFAWATPRKLSLSGPVTGEATIDGSGDVAMQTSVLAATDAQSGLVELATGTETVAGTDAARAVTPAGLAALTATESRRGLVELATDAEVDAGTDAERAVTPAGVKRRIDTRATTARKITAGNGLKGGGDLTADRTLELGTPGTLSGNTPNAVTEESHTHAIAVATDAVAGVVELATPAEAVAGTDAARAVTPAGLAAGLTARTATTSRAGLVELATAAEAVAGTDAERAVTPSTLADALSELLCGSVAYFATPDAPYGWTEADGGLRSRTVYARLFARIGTRFGAGDGVSTFNVPDLRGEFLRGWDDGRGIDAGRTFGSAQADELKSHSHLAYTGYSDGSYGGLRSALQTVDWGAAIRAGTIQATGGTETRPRNVALLACIKF